MVPKGSIWSNQARMKSGSEDSSLKNENLPNALRIRPVIMPQTMAANIPPAPKALWAKPIASSACRRGVMQMQKRMTPLIPAMMRDLRRRLFSIKLKGMRNAIISEIRPMVQLVSWPNCGHHSHPKADPGMLSSEKIEPRKIRGMVWLIESLSVITQTLWLILFIMGVKLDSIQSSSFFIRSS